MKRLAKVLGIVAVVLVVAGLAATVAGALLPKEHTATRRARFKASPEAIFAAIADVESFPKWRPDVERVERLSPTRWREVGEFGPITFQIVASDPPRRFVGRIADTDLAFGGTWTYVVTPEAGGGATLAITEDGVIHSALFRFFARYVFGYTATIEGYLRALGRKFGEDVQPAD